MDKSTSTAQNVLLLNEEQKQPNLFKVYFMARGNINQGQKFLSGGSVFWSRKLHC